MKRNNREEDEEIDSDEIPDVVSSDPEEEKEEDNFFSETPEEKRLRLAKEYLERTKKAKDDDDELIEQQLNQDFEEEKGTRFDSINISLSKKEPEPIRYRAHRGQTTSIVLGNGCVFSASKDGSIVNIQLEPRKHKLIGQLSSSVNSIDYHRSRKIIAAGDSSQMVSIFDEEECTLLHSLKGHRGEVTGVVFSQKGTELFSCSYDMNIRVWDIENGNCLTTLFGHQEIVLGIDYCGVCVSCGADRSLRLWKYIEEKQLLFQSSAIRSAIDSISMFNNTYCVTGSQDSKLCLWRLNTKKPIWVVKDPHGPGNWISSVAALRYRNICASGSNDGFVRFWEVKGDKLNPLFSVPLIGYINDMEFSENGEFLAVQVSNEQKLGRWLPSIKEARQGVHIIRLDHN